MKKNFSWAELSVAPAADPDILIANAKITNGATQTGTRLISNTYSYPSSISTLRIIAARVMSNAGGPIVPLAHFINPLSTQTVSAINLPNIIEVDFNFAPLAGSVNAGSFQLVGIATGYNAGAVVMVTATTARLTLFAPLIADTYFIELNGTTAPPINAGGISLDGEAIMLPSGSGSPGGDFVVDFIVIAAPVPAPLPPAPISNSLLWGPNFFSLSAAPTCISLHSDDQLEVANANQWNFDHQTLNASPQLPPPLQSWMYLRAGTQWQMQIAINLGSQVFTDLQLSFILNAATHGSWRQRVPVIAFNGAFTGLATLSVTLKTPGFFVMGLRAINSAGISSMFEMKWLSVT